MMCLLIVTRTTLMFHFRYIDGVADGVFAILRIAQHEERSTEPDHACVICNIDERSQEPKKTKNNAARFRLSPKARVEVTAHVTAKTGASSPIPPLQN